MTLIRTSLFSFTSTAIKVVSGLVINKLVASLIGPAGLATIGQLQNILQISMTLAQGGVVNGVVKYTAEAREERGQQEILLRTALLMVLVCSFFTSLGLIFFSGFIAEVILHDRTQSFLLVVLGISIVLFSLNGLFLGLLNGLQRIRDLFFVNIFQSLVGLAYTITLIYLFGLLGALLAVVTNQSLTFLMVVVKLWKSVVSKLRGVLLRLDIDYLKKLMSFSMMTVVSALAAPGTQLLLRDHILKVCGVDGAGQWQGILVISNTYLLVVTTTLATYFLPKLSETKLVADIRHEIRTGLLLVVPFVFFTSVAIFLLRDFAIDLLFSKAFHPMRDLFAWQLTGDMFKMVSWIFAYLLMAKAKIFLFVLTEIIFSTTYYLLGVLCVHFFGLEGSTIAYMINYVLYFICMIVIYKILMSGKSLQEKVALMRIKP